MLIEFYQGEMKLNWHELPDTVSSNHELRDKMLDELQDRYPPETHIDSKTLFEMNSYVMNRVQCILQGK